MVTDGDDDDDECRPTESKLLFINTIARASTRMGGDGNKIRFQIQSHGRRTPSPISFHRAALCSTRPFSSVYAYFVGFLIYEFA